MIAIWGDAASVEPNLAANSHPRALNAQIEQRFSGFVVST